ncbi:hypothetical protein A4G23_03419 [Streptomyces rubrolavendulae]|uniref:Uncharacterized protein n=1 Tax=Streptomyces rubrolavendulae TaxID=285473 RepID=A0A1D8G534_9ACTN|nr:hypothetical protein A4G23_03419 [Streptomyces rubrolavendulae]
MNVNALPAPAPRRTPGDRSRRRRLSDAAAGLEPDGVAADAVAVDDLARRAREPRSPTPVRSGGRIPAWGDPAGTVPEVRVPTLHEIRALDVELARIAAERAAAWAREVAAERADAEEPR